MMLYKKSANGSMQYWQIEIGYLGLNIEYGQVGGTPQERNVFIEENQSGRGWEEQAELEMNSRISKYIDKGYVETIAEAMKGATNAIGMKKPMLAHKYVNMDKLPKEVYLQYKYDGNRCLITKQKGVVFAYSRNGKPIKSIEHILDSAKDIPEGTVLDGELYHHGTPLQTLRSWIAKGQAESSKLVYMCYDIMEKSSYYKRLETLKNLNLGYPIKLAETTKYSTLELELELYNKLSKAIKDGYEGLIIRNPITQYEDGKRSKSLMKVKSWLDEEYKVLSITPSVDSWAILHLEHKGKRFKVTAPGTHLEKEKAFFYRTEYVGKAVTVQYANLTKGGVPFHPIAIAWRTDLD